VREHLSLFRLEGVKNEHTREVLLERSDTIFIEIGRSNEFPQHKGKDIITAIKIETLDSAA